VPQNDFASSVNLGAERGTIMNDYGNPISDMFADADSQASRQQFQRIKMSDADVIVCECFFNTAKSDEYFKALNENVVWKQEKAKLYGKFIDLPRLTAWYGEEGKSYTYSGITVNPEPWTPTLMEIKKAVEAVSGLEFNSVLLNKYRNERDSVAWHSDDEPELGKNPVIGSVSFGDTCMFKFKHKITGLRKAIALPHGSYLMMKGATQHHWLHQIAKQAVSRGARINLTFRVVG
jgi:alkylated DNA repair dioxygenase AlkB